MLAKTFFLTLAIAIAVKAAAQQPPAPEVNIPPAPSVYGAEIPDDRYRFASGLSTDQQIALTRTPEGVRFTWPRAGTSGWDTAILGVRSWGALDVKNLLFL